MRLAKVLRNAHKKVRQMKTFNSMLSGLLGARGFTDVPPEIAEFHLRDAAIDLCQKSHVWRQEVLIDVQSGVADYPIELADEGVVVAAVDVFMHGHRVQFGGNTTCHYNGSNFSVVNNNTLVVPSAKEDELQGLKLTVACKPSRDACGIADVLYEDWADVIADGAAARCAAMSKQSWSSAAMVGMYARQYAVGVTRAKNQRVMKRGTAPLMMKGSYF